MSSSNRMLGSKTPAQHPPIDHTATEHRNSSAELDPHTDVAGNRDIPAQAGGGDLERCGRGSPTRDHWSRTYPWAASRGGRESKSEDVCAAARQRGLSANRAQVAMVGRQPSVLTQPRTRLCNWFRVSSNCRGMLRRPDLTKRYHSEFN